MILFLYGPDTYRSRGKLNEVIARYKQIHKSGMSFHVLDAEESNFEDFKGAVNTVSMFGEKKLVALRGFGSSKEFGERFLLWKGKDALRDSRDTVCLFFENEIDKDGPLAVWLFKNAKCEDFGVLSGARLKKWAEQFLSKNGIVIEQAALARVLAETKGDLWGFENEVRKVWAYVRSEGGKSIRARDVSIFLRRALETHIFSLVDAFVEGNKARAWKLLRGHLAAGDNEQYLFSMVHHQFRNVAEARDFFERGEYDLAKIARSCNIHPYVAKKSCWQAKKFEKTQIKKIYQTLVELDRDMKTGRIDPRTALENLIFEIA